MLFKKYEAAMLNPCADATEENEEVCLFKEGISECEKDVVKSEDIADSSKNVAITSNVPAVAKEKESASKIIQDAESAMNFPERLMELIDSNDESVKKAICWLPGGETFAISPNHFSEQILSKYFQGSQFGSFIRKLNRW